MTIDEYLEEEKRRGNIISGGGSALPHVMYLAVPDLQIAGLRRRMHRHRRNSLLLMQSRMARPLEKRRRRSGDKRTKSGLGSPILMRKAPETP